jgi:hypothetical protein
MGWPSSQLVVNREPHYTQSTNSWKIYLLITKVPLDFLFLSLIFQSLFYAPGWFTLVVDSVNSAQFIITHLNSLYLAIAFHSLLIHTTVTTNMLMYVCTAYSHIK